MIKESTTQPWQLEMFQRSLKKQLKVKALVAQLGKVADDKGLFITCGDNNGALNWHFRSNGGRWTWADVSGENIAEIAGLLGEPVHHLPADSFPFPDEHFDLLVAIDVLEHLSQDQPFLREVRRVLKSGGLAIVTVPNGDHRLLANRIKWWLGMTPEVYGHTRAGYTVAELSEAIQSAGLNPTGSSGYSRFFTEMIELVINYGYVKILGKTRSGSTPGQIAPVSSQDLNQHGKVYRFYTVFYPIMRTISALDELLPKKTDNAVIVRAEKKG